MITFLIGVVGIFFELYLAESHEHNKEFVPYFDDYITLVNQNCKIDQYNYPNKTTIKFVDALPQQDWVGLCEQSVNFIPILSYWDIKVVKSEWNKLNESDKRLLIYHELSHCMLGKKHVEDSSNYMYYHIIDLDLKTLNDQVLEDAWNHCGAK